MSAKRGVAPPVAAENKRSAQARIDAKVACMRAVLSLDAPSVELLAKLPHSLRQFNLWNERQGKIGRGLPEVDLERNAPQTLREDEDRTGLVEGLISLLGAVTGGKRISSRELRLATAKARLDLAEKLRSISEARLAALFIENELLRRQLRALEAKRASTVARLNAALRERDERLELEKQRVAELTGTISKMTPMKVRR